jgi:probable rRNA maturation factor
VHIFVADEQDVPLSTDSLRMLADLVMREESLPVDTEVSILLVHEDQIAEYNERFMGRAGPTDVLAFPLEAMEPGVIPRVDPGGPPLSLGDVVIAPSYVRAQAADHGVTFDQELSLMVVHGLLHLLGYDHMENGEAEHMEERERRLLGLAGVL